MSFPAIKSSKSDLGFDACLCHKNIGLSASSSNDVGESGKCGK